MISLKYFFFPDRLTKRLDEPIKINVHLRVCGSLSHYDEILALVQGDEVVEEDTELKKPKVTVTEAFDSIEKLTTFFA